ncbi:hypothetical protein MMPV_005268 [Pyropia vietnamensis]
MHWRLAGGGTRRQAAAAASGGGGTRRRHAAAARDGGARQPLEPGASSLSVAAPPRAADARHGANSASAAADAATVVVVIAIAVATAIAIAPAGTNSGGGERAAGSAAPASTGDSGSCGGGGGTSGIGIAGDSGGAGDSNGGGDEHEDGGGASGAGPSGSGGKATGGHGGGVGGSLDGGDSAPPVSGGGSPDDDGDGGGGSGGHSVASTPAGSGGSPHGSYGSGGDGGGGFTDGTPGSGITVEGDDNAHGVDSGNSNGDGDGDGDGDGNGDGDGDGNGSGGEGSRGLSDSGSDLTINPLVMLTEWEVLPEVAFVLDRPPHRLNDPRWIEWLSTPMDENPFQMWQAEQMHLMEVTRRHVGALVHGCFGMDPETEALDPLVARMPYPLARMTYDGGMDEPSNEGAAAIFFAAPLQDPHGHDGLAFGERRPGPRLPPTPPLLPFLELLFRGRDLPPLTVSLSLYLMYRARLVLSGLIICDRSIYRLLVAAVQMVTEDLYSDSQPLTPADDVRLVVGGVWGEVAAEAVEDATELAEMMRLVAGDVWDVDSFDLHWLIWYLRFHVECHRYTCCRAVAASSPITPPPEGAISFYDDMLATITPATPTRAFNCPPSAMPSRATAEGGPYFVAVHSNEPPPSVGGALGDAEGGGPAADEAAASSSAISASAPNSATAGRASSSAPATAGGAPKSAAASGASSAAVSRESTSAAAIGASAPAAASSSASPADDWLEGLPLAHRQARQPPRRSRTSRQQRAEAVAEAGRAAAAAAAAAAAGVAAAPTAGRTTDGAWGMATPKLPPPPVETPPLMAGTAALVVDVAVLAAAPVHVAVLAVVPVHVAAVAVLMAAAAHVAAVAVLIAAAAHKAAVAVLAVAAAHKAAVAVLAVAAAHVAAVAVLAVRAAHVAAVAVLVAAARSWTVQAAVTAATAAAAAVATALAAAVAAAAATVVAARTAPSGVNDVDRVDGGGCRGAAPPATAARVGEAWPASRPSTRSNPLSGERRAEGVPPHDDGGAASSVGPSEESSVSKGGRRSKRPLSPSPPQGPSDGAGLAEGGGDGDYGGGGLLGISRRVDPVWPALTDLGDDQGAPSPVLDQFSHSAAETGPVARPATGLTSQVLSPRVPASGDSPLDGQRAPRATAVREHLSRVVSATGIGTSHPGVPQAVPAAAATQANPASVAEEHVPLPAVATLRGDPVSALRSGARRQLPIGTPPAVASSPGARWSASPATGAGSTAPAATPFAAAHLSAVQVVGAAQTAPSISPTRPPVIDRVPPRDAAPLTSSPLDGFRASPGASRGAWPSEPAATGVDPAGAVSPAATFSAATGAGTSPRRHSPQPTTADAASPPLPTLATVESTPLVPQLPTPPPSPPLSSTPSGGPSPLYLPPGTDMEAVVAASLTALTPNFPDPLWPPFTADLREVHAWRSATTDAAAAAAVAVRWRRAAAAAAAAVGPPGVVPQSAAAAASSAAVAVETATTASDVMRRATERITVYPLLVAGAPATALPIRHGSDASPFSVPTPCAVTPTGTPDVRAVLTELAAGVPGGLPPVTLVTAVALLHRFQSVDPVGAVLSPYTAGRLLAAALLAARRTPGVPPLPAIAVTRVGALGVADVEAAAHLEEALVTRLADEGVVVGLAEQEATTWLLLWHWGPAV